MVALNKQQIQWLRRRDGKRIFFPQKNHIETHKKLHLKIE